MKPVGVLSRARVLNANAPLCSRRGWDRKSGRSQLQANAANQRMQDLRLKLPTEYENHGWVWLFLRKPAQAKASEQ